LVAEGVTPFALTALKYGLLALLFLFIWRATRWVVRGLNVDRAPSLPSTGRRAAAGSTGGPIPTTLLVHSGDGAKPKPVRLEAGLTVGRAPECELRLDDTYASSQHARIFGKNGSWYVEDLGSTNGTFVNGSQVDGLSPLAFGDEIQVGQVKLRLERARG
jgi:pSer/pThr/pTyr-binding forkhead associated (FHA) protein